MSNVPQRNQFTIWKPENMICCHYLKNINGMAYQITLSWFKVEDDFYVIHERGETIDPYEGGVDSESRMYRRNSEPDDEIAKTLTKEYAERQTKKRRQG